MNVSHLSKAPFEDVVGGLRRYTSLTGRALALKGEYTGLTVHRELYQNEKLEGEKPLITIDYFRSPRDLHERLTVAHLSPQSEGKIRLILPEAGGAEFFLSGSHTKFSDATHRELVIKGKYSLSGIFTGGEVSTTTSLRKPL